MGSSAASVRPQVWRGRAGETMRRRLVSVMTDLVGAGGRVRQLVIVEIAGVGDPLAGRQRAEGGERSDALGRTVQDQAAVARLNPDQAGTRGCRTTRTCGSAEPAQ